ncbi:hypothetical protein LCI18_007942 [Fusarium solani-melongenae]|uniref:Uncharacterized protein n=1 Tax=Fusarium solani subsp. cucurbitae TaxID=2747967 RepID=A0ACD3Z726_FUSSC|nr:hypothetical protein LCI18_007942 [Fusarium solani-melongenae]
MVVDFFEDMKSFLARIVIIEKRIPNSKPYHNCLMDVFTAFLSMSGIATKYIDLGRFKKWASTLVKGEDSDLKEARRHMDKTLDRLKEATRDAILRNTENLQERNENLQKMNEELLENQEHHTRVLEEQAVQLNTIREEVHEIAKLVAAWQWKREKDETGQGRGKGMEEQLANSRPLAQIIRSYLGNVEVRIAEYHILKETMVLGTCTWFFAEEAWADWLSNQQGGTRSPLLSVVGEPGTGKGHLAAAIYDHLCSKFREGPDEKDDNCVAHFYFRDNRESLGDFNKAIASVVYQVSEQSTSACKQIHRELCCRKLMSDEVDVTEWKELLDELLAPVFNSRSKRRLFLVFDGIDELEEDEVDSLSAFLNAVVNRGLRIYVCFTSQSGALKINAGEAGTTLSQVVMDKQKQLPDIKALAWDRVNGLDGLKKFSRYVKQRIAEKIEEVAPSESMKWNNVLLPFPFVIKPCLPPSLLISPFSKLILPDMLYAEHMLHRYSILAREGAVLQDMKKPAPMDIDALYESMVDECYQRTATEHRGAVAALLQWISFSYSPLTLDDITSLLRFVTKDDSFVIEDIPQPFSKFLRIGHPRAPAEEEEGNDPASAEVRNEGEGRLWTLPDLLDPDKLGSDYLEEQFKDGVLPVDFQVRQMRSFFCRWNTPRENRGRQQTTACSELRKTSAQAFRDMFLVSAQLVHPDAKETLSRLAPGLQKCVVCHVLFYWLNIEPENSTLAENKAVMEAFHALFSSKNGYAEMVLQQDGEIPYKSLVKKVRKWKSIAAADGHLLAQLAPEDQQWWFGVLNNPPKILGYLVKGNVRAMYRSSDLVSAKKAYAAARETLHIAGVDGKVVEQASKNYGDQIVAWGRGPEWLPRKYVLLGIPGLFPDLEMDPAAHCVTAELLYSYKHMDFACQAAHMALEQAGTPDQKLRASELLARIQLKMGEGTAAHRTMTRCIREQEAEGSGAAPSLRRRAYVTLARIERSMGNISAAAASYAAAKASDSEGLTPGDILAEEVGLFDSVDQYPDLMAAIRCWKLSDQVAYLTWILEDEHSLDLLRKAARNTGSGSFLVDTYIKAIHYLDNVDAGAPMRCELATVQRTVCSDLESARQLLDEVLDSRHSSRDSYMFTKAPPEVTASNAVLMQSSTLEALFHQATDPEHKARLFQSVKGLTQRPLVLDLPEDHLKILLQSHHLKTARMARKMGPAADFQSQLKEVIDTCFQELSDDASWNDPSSLLILARALAFLSQTVSGAAVEPRLLWAARVLGSAMFSQLDPEVTSWGSQVNDVGSGKEGGEEEEEEDGEEDDEDDEEEDDDDETSTDNNGDSPTPPTDEGDLNEIFQKHGLEGVPCRGFACNPKERYCWWGGRIAYLCIACDTFLCMTCHASRQTANYGKEAQNMTLCSRNHTYLQVPVEGWKGITAGRMTAQDAKGDVRDVKFGEYLKEVQEMCEEAWEAFWQGP